MVLRRIGNKSKIASEIQKYFPKHHSYIEPFFGAGGMFFNKPKATHNFLNDIDSDVFNLFQVIKDSKEEFIDLFEKMPIHNELFDWWIKNQETKPLNKAIRFVMLSNFSLYGKGDTLRLGCVKPKEMLLRNIEKTFDYLKNVQFTNCDFRKMFKSISLEATDRGGVFIYADPPYLQSVDNYSHSFKEEDCSSLFDVMILSKCKFAYSEFDNPFILKQASQRNLNVITIGERQTLKSRRVEILVTNYITNQQSLFQ